MKIVKILKEIKELDISIEEIVTIKLMNSLSNLFKIYLTKLSQKIRDNNKLLNLQIFFSNLKDKKCCIKQTTKVKLAKSQITSLSITFSKSGLSLHAQSSQGSHGQSYLGKVGSSTTGGTNDATAIDGLSASLFSSNQNNF